ncbi:inorganic pyrophosphatase 2, mitochondrial isoform X2 [Siniperca chuatsi]|uniref:inorganic pyrophosphatase 2, mitochondrial isoform X2 n=1 Tax=Siniperca chuatsi TaxID=119488 RepID=UPI001CE0ED88|nr:inorganic pyrophosphatase 2, mitochondrial isoform X2 [Siniperca chuatsi]
MTPLLLRSSLGCLVTVFGSFSASRNKLVTQAAAVPHLYYLRKTMHYQTEERGHPNSPDYRIYFKTSEGKYISPFHDIPLTVETEQDNDVPAKKPKKNESEVLFNMVVEVPRWSNAKMETWEDPNHTDKETKCCGDNDPIDVCEIGTQVCFPGQVIQVKVLGILAMIDEGEMDWKVIAINAEDPDAKNLNNIEDVRKSRPGHLEATVDWFRKYKVPDGKPENQFGFNGQFRDKDLAAEIIKSTHEHWRALVQKQTNSGGIECKNISCCESPFKCSADETRGVVQSAPAFGSAHPVSPEVDKWHFV